MNLIIHGPNQTEIEVDNGRVFFSYKTPVAAIINGITYRTQVFHSVTTSKHVAKWLQGLGRNATVRSQSWFDALLHVTVNMPQEVA